jgi:quinate/shikimate dehydrogenase (NAD+)
MAAQTAAPSGVNAVRRDMLVGLIGANIQNSLSPALFADVCEAAGLRGYYHLMDVDRLPGRSLEDVLGAVCAAGFAGVNVTYPFKEAVPKLLDEVSDEARQIGAVNTVTISRDGATKGYNTDRTGFRRSFETTLGRDAVAGQTALLVGAGGAGRAVAFALFDLGVQTLLVSDKNEAQAAGLVAALTSQFGSGRCRVERGPASALADAVGAVNATPVGMTGIPGMPISPAAIEARHWVADVIYSPLETDLLKAARARGARVMGGAGMCVHQAAEAFRLFTGVTPDVGRLHAAFAQAAALRDRASAVNQP